MAKQDLINAWQVPRVFFW